MGVAQNETGGVTQVLVHVPTYQSSIEFNTHVRTYFSGEGKRTWPCWSKSKARLAPCEHPNPTTKIGTKMGGEITYQPKWDTKTVLNHGHMAVVVKTVLGSHFGW